MNQTSLLSGNIRQQILTLAVPLLLGNILQQLYNTADSLIVGRFLGTNAFASWPGEALSKDGDWYNIQVPGWINSVIINANEGAVQTTDLSVEAGKEVWVVVTDAENAQVFYEAPAQDAAATEPAAETTVPASTEASQEAAKSSNTGVIVGVVAAVVLLGGGAAIVTKKKKS